MKVKSEPGRMQILVVDDEVDIRDACERILTRMNFHVFTASQGDEALRILKREQVALVLLDLKMPGIDGLEVLKRIHDIDETILVIVITGYATVEMAIEAMKQGAYDFIAKPFETDPLRIVVQRASEKIRLTREARQLDLERRRTLADLDTEKSRVRTILESLPTGIVVTNAACQVVLMNPTFLRLLDLDSHCRAGQKIESYLKDKKFCNFVMNISQGEYESADEVPTYELELTNEKYLMARGRPIMGEDKECLGAVLTISDITTMKTLDRLKSEFVAEVSHELRSPLSTIHEQLAMVISDMTEQKISKDVKILARALEKTHGLISLVGDLLDLSRIEEGSAYQEKKPVHLEETLKNIVDFLTIKAKANQNNLTLRLPRERLPVIICDPLALESIFGNLVANAINYTQKGGNISVEAHADSEGIFVSVADDGMGIEKRNLERIFKRFYRVRNEKTRHIIGTGLGLPIVKELVDRMGGNICVKTKPGNGSTFTVFLPSVPKG